MTAVQRCARWSSPDLEPGVLSPGLCTSVSSVFGQVQLIPPFQNMLVFREIGRLDQVTFLSLPFPLKGKQTCFELGKYLFGFCKNVILENKYYR